MPAKKKAPKKVPKKSKKTETARCNDCGIKYSIHSGHTLRDCKEEWKRRAILAEEKYEGACEELAGPDW